MIRLWLALVLALAFGRTTFAHCVGVADVEVLPAPQILEGDPVTIEVLIVTCSYPASLYQPTELTIDGQTILIDIYAEGGMADTADWILEPVPLGPLKSGVYSYTIVTHRIPEQGGGSDIFEDTFCVDTAKCGFLPCKCRPIVPTYAITKLDTLGGTGGVALAVNDLGQVTGRAYTPEGQCHAFLWTAGELIDLGTFRPFSHSEGWGMNNVAQVVGIATNSGDFSRGFLWDKGKMIDLGDLADPGWTDTQAYAVNDHGQIVGRTHNSSFESRAFLWQKGVMAPLHSQFGELLGIARDINSAGHIAGSFWTNNTTHPFLWIDGVATDLGTLGGSFAAAYGVNDFDQVVGKSERPEGEHLYHAFLWDKGKMIDLGEIGEFSSSLAYAINNSGQVIGVPSFLYHSETGLRVFSDLLAYDTEWSSVHPRDINNVGQIVGSGVYQGSHGSKPFLMTPIDADFNDDGDVDLADFACFQVCFTGPELPPGEECQSHDIDRDGDVDLDDFDSLQWVMEGP